VLEEVVVTGSPSGGPRRELTVAMDAIDGRRLARRGAGSMAEVLNAAVPGIWAWRDTPSSLTTQFASVRGASSFGATYPKIYLDGVEVANPLLVTEIDVEGVERVEVIRGPQGAALYGSDAISGVINIVTRHGGTADGSPRPELVSRAGATGSSFAESPLPTHEHRLALRTGSNLASGSLSVQAATTGDVYPGADSRRLGAAGGGRWVTPAAIFSATGRLTDRRSGVGRNPLLLHAQLDGDPAPGALAVDSLRQALTQYTLSGSATVAPSSRWTHTLLAGVDGYRLDYLEDSLGPFPVPLDSALRLARGTGLRATLRGSSTARLEGEGGRARGTLTVAAEHSVLRQNTISGVRHDGIPKGESWRQDTGILAQASGSWNEAWFLTAGARLERNEAIRDQDLALLPMLGGAWVAELGGGTELKLRAAYGRGIRAPYTPVRLHLRSMAQNVVSDLDPEVQSGIEFGAELHVGQSLTLAATRFDQSATGLIQDVVVGVDSMVHNGRVMRRARYQLQNVGAIDNRGWEAQATVRRGELGVYGAVALVDSRVANLAVGYRGDLRQGDRMLGVPSSSLSLGADWAAERWSGSVSVSRAWDWINYDRLALASALAAADSVPPQALMGPRLRTYWREHAGSTELRATLWRRVRPGVWMTASGENLLGGQLGEPDNVTIRPGRTVTLGLRASL
jgi:iron complex outermembrane recepter protein